MIMSKSRSVLGPHLQHFRLNRYLALCGAASRRDALELVRTGRVEVNGRVVTEPGYEVVCGKDEVRLDGERLRPPDRWYFYAYNKPRGVLVTLEDPQGRESVAAVLAKLPPGVFPVGRLDRASEGLLLFTNEGDLASKLLHPSSGVERTYYVHVVPRPRPAQLALLRVGVELGRGERTLPAKVHVKKAGRGGVVLRMTLFEGKKREIRRMCRAVGLRVIRLRRISFCGVQLGNLPPGRFRPLTSQEIAELRRAVGQLGSGGER